MELKLKFDKNFLDFKNEDCKLFYETDIGLLESNITKYNNPARITVPIKDVLRLLVEDSLQLYRVNIFSRSPELKKHYGIKILMPQDTELNLVIEPDDDIFSSIPDFNEVELNVPKLVKILTVIQTEDDCIGFILFLSPDDFKYCCNVQEVPNKRFSFGLWNIKVHYIPGLNKSFIMSERDL